MRKPRKIYIAGKVSGLPYDVSYRNFMLAEIKLINRGETVNPMRICKAHWSWLRCMIVCVWNLTMKCDRIYLLNNWHKSKGARIEVWFAILVKKEILNS